MVKEIWRQVPRHEFIVSNFGRVRSKDRSVSFLRNGKWQTCLLKGWILSPWPNRQGYLFVSRQEGGKRPKFLVSRLVGMAFCPGYKPGLTINHLNGIKTDNRPKNLEWCTLAENTRHQWKIGLCDTNKGEKHNFAKFSDKKIVEMRAKFMAGNSPTLLSREYGVSVSYLYMLGKGTRRARSG